MKIEGGLPRDVRRALKYRKGALRHLGKLEVWTLEKRERPVEERTFEQDGVSFTLALRTPNACELSQAHEIARRLMETHVRGADGTGPVPFPGDVTLTETFCLLMATFAVMQAPKNPADRYEVEELIRLSDLLPDAWGQAHIWAKAKLDRWEKSPGNGRAAP